MAQILKGTAAADHLAKAQKPVKTIGFLVLPNFTTIGFASAVETLRIANMAAHQILYRTVIIAANHDPVTASNGMRVLLLNAIVENRTGREVMLPKLRADLLIDGQVIASTYIEPPVDSLDGGESRGIVTRLQHPGGKMPEVRLSFEEAGASRS